MYPITSSSFLSPEFIEEVVRKPPKFKGPLMEVIALRTYSAYVDAWKRRETWAETCQRDVEWVMSLYTGYMSKEELTGIAEALFEAVYNLKLFPSGRSLWVGGRDAVKKSPASAFNCSAHVIQSLEDICESFYLLLCGCGVGFSVERAYTDKLPLIYGGKSFENITPNTKMEHRFEETYVKLSDGNLLINVGDSKEAWVEALRQFLDAFADPNIGSVSINYDNIRPKGERIKTFGGFAPGPDGMFEMFENLYQLLNPLVGVPLRRMQVVDIHNFIAKNVIIGGNRRSSEIGLSDPDDEEFIFAKSKDNMQTQRQMSNNSLVVKGRVTKEWLKAIFDRIKYNGEPGFFNLSAALLRRPNVKVINPCAEILLDSKGFCNLSTVVVTSHITDKDELNVEDLLNSVELATFIGVCVTNVDVELPEWDRIQKRDRLIGVSMTGFMDAIDRLGLEFDNLNVKALLCAMREKANDVASKLAYDMRIPRPLLVTCVKPEGSISLLPTVSSGIHRSFAPYFIRRVRYAPTDPVAKALTKLGMKGFEDPDKKERLIFEFPISTGAKMAADDEPAIDQFRRYLMFMECYVDHNASCTLTLAPEEHPEIIDAVYENWDNVVAVAWLPKNKIPYKFPPFEAISKDQYDQMMVEFPDLTGLVDEVNQIERSYYEFDLEEIGCEKGACPIR